MLFAVRNLRVERVNLLMNDFAAGLPSPLAFLGLAAAVAPELGGTRWGSRVMPILHEVHAAAGRTKAEKALKSSEFKPVEIAEDMVGFVRASLLLDIPECTSSRQVADALLGRRLGGGTIVNEKIDVGAVPPDGRAFRELPRGYAVLPPDSDELSIVASGRVADLQAFAGVLFPMSGTHRPGWWVPVAAGHRLLENPDSVPRRRHTRDSEIPHVFSEPLVGIAELISVRSPRLVECDEVERDRRMWRWVAEDEWIVGHPTYHPKNRRTSDTEA